MALKAARETLLGADGQAVWPRGPSPPDGHHQPLLEADAGAENSRGRCPVFQATP